jgi:hypothetical protein
MAAVVQFNTKSLVSCMFDTIYGLQPEGSLFSDMYHNRMNLSKKNKGRRKNAILCFN